MFDAESRKLSLVADSRFEVMQNPVIIEKEYGKFKTIVPTSEIFKWADDSKEEHQKLCRMYTLFFTIEDFVKTFIIIALEIRVDWTIQKDSVQNHFNFKNSEGKESAVSQILHLGAHDHEHASFKVTNMKWIFNLKLDISNSNQSILCNLVSKDEREVIDGFVLKKGKKKVKFDNDEDTSAFVVFPRTRPESFTLKNNISYSRYLLGKEKQISIIETQLTDNVVANMNFSQ